MPYTAAQLTTFYSNLHMGMAPNALNTLKISGYADQNAVGGLSDAQAVTAIAQTGDMDVAVAVAAYQFFTGKIPTEAGMTYLVNSAVNTSDLNDSYYNTFNLENRYINFAFNLGLFGDGAAAFATAFGSLTFAQAVDAAYEKIIGSSFAANAGINAVAAKANITGRQAYFQAIADQNLSGASAAMKDLGVKAGMVGYIMAEALKADVGVYALGINAFMSDLALDGKATFEADLVTAYSVPANAAGNGKALTLTANADTGASFIAGFGDDVFSAELNGTGQQTLNAGDNIDGGAGTNTLNATLKSSVTPAGLANIQIVSVSNMDDAAGGTSPNLDLTNAAAVTTVKVHDVGDPQGIQVTNIQTAVGKFEVANSAGNVIFQVKAAALGGATDAATVTLSNVTGGSITVGSGAAGSGYETLTLHSTGGANTIATLTDGASDKWTTLKVTGTSDLTFSSNITDAVTTVDGKDMTAKLAVGFSNGQAVTITGGKGDDTFNFAGADYVGGAAAGRDVIDGGDGLDTLSVSSAVAIAQAATPQTNLTSIERLLLNTNLTATLDTTAYTGMTEIAFGAVVTGGTNVKIDSGDTVSFLTTTAAPTLTVDGFSLSDTATVKLAAGVSLGGTLTANGVETLTLNVDAGGNTVSAVTVTPTAATGSLKITGSGALTLGVASAGIVDASTMGAGGSLAMVLASTVSLAVTGSAGNDQLVGSTFADLLSGGAGDDLIVGLNGYDKVNLGGGGKDTVFLSDVSVGADRDLVSGFTTGAGADADVVTLTAAFTSAPTAAAAPIVIQDMAAAPAAPVVFNTAVNDMLELSFALAGAGGVNDLDNFTDATGLLAALGQTVSASAAGQFGYILAYQGGSAYLYLAVDSNVSTTFTASEIQLIGTFEGVAVGGFEVGNFLLA